MTIAKEHMSSAELRRQVGHPIIDSDGHYSELLPVFRDYFLDYAKQVGGGQIQRQLEALSSDLYEQLVQHNGVGQAFPSRRWAQMSPSERRDSWTIQPGWGPPHRNALDRATSYLPELLHSRMDEFGIDYMVLYPGSGLLFPHIEDEELRRIACRALNTYNAESYRACTDRMTPAAVIPMYTPQEAIEELEHAVTVLGLKVAMIGHVVRPVPAVHRERPEFSRVAFRLDTFGLDSDYDYDPFWAKCAELRVPLTAHQPSYGVGHRRSLTNYIYNQTGNFAEAGDLLCKSLFLGGVTRRHPTLKFQFLECGVGWACTLFSELVARWQKRNPRAIEEHIEAARSGQGQLIELIDQHGGRQVKEHLPELTGFLTQQRERAPWARDDWEACQIQRVEDVRDLFVPHFYFGCEADDPMTAWAFNRNVNPFGVQLRATLGSDLGHWDVPDMREVVEEAHEMVDRGLITEDDFRRFTFTYPAELYAGVNPAFFEGTGIEEDIAEFLRDGKRTGASAV